MGSLIKIAVPNGIDTAMENLTKAILEEQPPDIYKFAYQYFQKKLQLRLEAEIMNTSDEQSNSPTKDSTAAGGENEFIEKVCQEYAETKDSL
ncbi:hypothetical protein O3M35_003960 [Rhynocoris fuscipes]|uniref:RIIa domain-containing protein n=1 Tax=Rhynocoris fuscipes TaxID=488301 RepID=A0AAW1CMN6_9HEMI